MWIRGHRRYSSAQGVRAAALGLGLLTSTVATSQLQATLMPVFLLLPPVLLSGTIFERALMPVPMQVVAYLIPLTYYIDILRGILLRGAGLQELWPSVIPLFAYGLLAFAFASIRFARTTP